MRLKTISLLLITLLTSTVLAQELPEYGQITELQGKQKVYIAAESVSSRKIIANELKKQFILVDSPDEAEFILLYTVESSTESLGRRRSHYMRSQLTAYVQTEKRKRILWQDDETYEESSGFSLSRPNEMNLAKNFLKALKKAK